MDEILKHQPARLALTHFGVVEGTEEIAEHVERLRATLAAWSERVRSGMTQDEFVAAAHADLVTSEGENASLYERAMPPDQSYLGLERYWRKKGERDAEAAATG